MVIYDLVERRISIHAAREGGDASMDPFTANNLGFQSTPPVKAATSLSITKSTQREFQSTPPVKAATYRRKKDIRAVCISIHAAREGGDIDADKMAAEEFISIHAAREGGDAWLYRLRRWSRDFNPRRP